MRIIIIVASVFGIAGLLLYGMPGNAVELSGNDMEKMSAGGCKYVAGTGGGSQTGVGAQFKCCDCADTRNQKCYGPTQEDCPRPVTPGAVCANMFFLVRVSGRGKLGVWQQQIHTPTMGNRSAFKLKQQAWKKQQNAEALGVSEAC